MASVPRRPTVNLGRRQTKLGGPPGRRTTRLTVVNTGKPGHGRRPTAQQPPRVTTSVALSDALKAAPGSASSDDDLTDDDDDDGFGEEANDEGQYTARERRAAVGRRETGMRGIPGRRETAVLPGHGHRGSTAAASGAAPLNVGDVHDLRARLELHARRIKSALGGGGSLRSQGAYETSALHNHVEAWRGDVRQLQNVVDKSLRDSRNLRTEAAAETLRGLSRASPEERARSGSNSLALIAKADLRMLLQYKLRRLNGKEAEEQQFQQRHVGATRTRNSAAAEDAAAVGKSVHEATVKLERSLATLEISAEGHVGLKAHLSLVERRQKLRQDIIESMLTLKRELDDSFGDAESELASALAAGTDMHSSIAEIAEHAANAASAADEAIGGGSGAAAGGAARNASARCSSETQAFIEMCEGFRSLTWAVRSLLQAKGTSGAAADLKRTAEVEALKMRCRALENELLVTKSEAAASKNAIYELTSPAVETKALQLRQHLQIEEVEGSMRRLGHDCDELRNQNTSLLSANGALSDGMSTLEEAVLKLRRKYVTELGHLRPRVQNAEEMVLTLASAAEQLRLDMELMVGLVRKSASELEASQGLVQEHEKEERVLRDKAASLFEKERQLVVRMAKRDKLATIAMAAHGEATAACREAKRLRVRSDVERDAALAQREVALARAREAGERARMAHEEAVLSRAGARSADAREGGHHRKLRMRDVVVKRLERDLDELAKRGMTPEKEQEHLALLKHRDAAVAESERLAAHCAKLEQQAFELELALGIARHGGGGGAVPGALPGAVEVDTADASVGEMSLLTPADVDESGSEDEDAGSPEGLTVAAGDEGQDEAVVAGDGGQDEGVVAGDGGQGEGVAADAHPQAVVVAAEAGDGAQDEAVVAGDGGQGEGVAAVDEGQDEGVAAVAVPEAVVVAAEGLEQSADLDTATGLETAATGLDTMDTATAAPAAPALDGEDGDEGSG